MCVKIQLNVRMVSEGGTDTGFLTSLETESRTEGCRKVSWLLIESTGCTRHERFERVASTCKAKNKPNRVLLLMKKGGGGGDFSLS